jgi:hypothetical protein
MLPIDLIYTGAIDGSHAQATAALFAPVEYAEVIEHVYVRHRAIAPPRADQLGAVCELYGVPACKLHEMAVP